MMTRYLEQKLCSPGLRSDSPSIQGLPVCCKPSVPALCLCQFPKNSLGAEGRVGAVLCMGTMFLGQHHSQHTSCCFPHSMQKLEWDLVLVVLRTPDPDLFYMLLMVGCQRRETHSVDRNHIGEVVQEGFALVTTPVL